MFGDYVTKCVAPVCQHQLSFLFMTRLRLWGSLTSISLRSLLSPLMKNFEN